MQKTNFKTYYIDAFAGTGKARMREMERDLSSLSFDDFYANDEEYQEFQDGSALQALSTDNPFDGYLFLEPDPARATELNLALEGHSRKKLVRIREEESEIALERYIVKNPKINWKYSRAVCFLDPYAMEVQWDVLKSIASTQSIEVIINFPLGMAIRRLLQNNAEIPQNLRIKLSNYFGTDEWFNVVYKDTPDLFGTMIKKAEDAEKRLLNWYVDRLQKLFGYAATPRLVSNTRGSHLYYLIWAGPNAKGLKIANHIMKMSEVVEKSAPTPPSTAV